MNSQDLQATESETANKAEKEAEKYNLSLQEVIHIHYSGDVETAKKGYQYYVDQNVDTPAPYSNLAAIFINEKRYQEAISLLNKSLEIAPNYVYSHLNLSNILMEYGRFNEASQGFITAYNLDKSLKGALCNHWTMRMHMCDWSEYQEMQNSLRKASWEQIIDTRSSDISNEIHPFSMMSICDDPDLLLKVSKDYVLSKTASIKGAQPLFRQQNKQPGQPVKMAFVSADLRAHPCGYLIAELFELIDPEQFEIHAISHSDPTDTSLIRQRIKSACHYFHDVSAKSDIQIAQVIADLDIDIAVDCHGHTKASRPCIFAYRPAPIQINQLGYPGTMGADYMDYMLADPFIIPEEMQGSYAEKIAYLPDTIQLNDRQRKVSSQQPSRKDCGLPDNAFVFCSHNNSLKLTPDIFAAWMNILKETPNSVLWLYGNNPWARKNLFTEAEAHGVKPWRLIFADKVPYDQHLARIKNADLFLDTLPYNAHSTTNDALWMGIPLVTCSGKGFAARVAGSNLRAADLEELITYDLDSYKALALELAHNPKKLGQIKEKLARNKDTCTLFDTERMIQNIEKAYQYMADLHRSGAAPETFYVDQLSSEKIEQSVPNKIPAPQIKQIENFGECIGKEDFSLQDVIDIHLAGQNELATIGYQEFIDVKVLNSIPYSNLASIHIEENKFDKAIPLLEEAIRIEPEDVDAHVKLAVSLDVVTDRKSKESIKLLLKAIHLEQNYATAHLILGGAYMGREMAEEAIGSFKKAISIEPQLALAYYNLGTLYMKLNRLHESAESFLHAFDIDPALTDAISKYWSINMKMCDWSEFHNLESSLLKVARDQDTNVAAVDVTRAITPFSLLSITDDPALHLKTAHDYSLALTQLVKSGEVLFKNKKVETGSLIKIAFVSGDMRTHALGYLITELFELMNKEQFEVYAISLSPVEKNCEITKRIQSACGHYIDVASKTDREVAQLIADLEIDIAVDCHGFTEDCRPAIFAYRPAPIQVNQIGYPGTMGADFIDYIFADPFLIPEEKQVFYSEKIAYLPDTIQLNDRLRKIASEQPTRTDCGLPEDAFVFCCFNNNHKITPDIFTLWMELLKETPTSVLWLFENNHWAKENLLAEANAQNVDPSRLIFAGKLPYEQYLSRLRNADLFLDTLPYNAHSSANDALWMGLPLVTCSGESFAARVAGSNLRSANLQELITDDLMSYKAVALELALNPRKLKKIKDRLINNRDTCALFDTKRMVRNFEKAYQKMINIYREGCEPETFYVLATEEQSSQPVAHNISLQPSVLQDAVNAHISGDLLSARNGYQELIKANLSDPLPYANMADIYIQDNQYQEALPLLKEAVAIAPDDFSTQMKLSIVLEILTNAKSADTIKHLQKAIQIEPENTVAHFSLGTAQGSRGNIELAIASFSNAIKYEPDLAIAHYNLGLLFQKTNQLNDAAESFHKAIAIDQTLNNAINKYWNIRLKMCDWSDNDSMKNSIEGAIEQQFSHNEKSDSTKSISPFPILSMFDDPELHLKLAKEYVLAKTNLTGSTEPLFRQRPNVAEQPIKIAFVSGDFREHPLGFLIVELFELIDKKQFEIHAVSFSDPDDNSIIRQRIQSACNHFHEVSNKTDKQIAQLIADQEIEIAVDCHGFTADCRPAIFAHRPAPIQINQLGYPGTMGADFMDYVLADSFIIPENQQIYYSEKIAYLPDTIQLNDRKRKIATKQPTRSDCGLPEDGFVFCCFNNNQKITPEMFSLWMNLLRETPGSTLWLYESNDWVKNNLQAEAESRGVDSSRLVFAKKCPYAEYLARIKNADLFLDTLPYNAHSTANDALWVGLPVITCSGNSFAARVAGSNLRSAGLDELITLDLNAYTALALELAHNPAKLSKIKEKLISNRDTCSLFDTPQLIKNFESAYLHMAGLYRSGSKPETFYVSRLGKNPMKKPSPEIIHTESNDGDLLHHYTSCPVCESLEVEIYLDVDWSQHPLYISSLPKDIVWMNCLDCQHSFKSSYFSSNALDIMSSKDQKNEIAHNLEHGRYYSASLIDKVLPFCSTGTWLDVGIDSADLLLTAYEYGYTPIGIDLSANKTEALKSIGAEAYCGSIESYTGNADVISMIDSFQCMPYPGQALKASHKILNEGGVLLLSMPNATSPLWHALSKENKNPYWNYPKHIHNFGRELLYQLLQMHGFSVKSYGVSASQLIGMEIIAIKEKK